MNTQFSNVVSQEQINRAVAALQANGINASVVPTGAEAKAAVLSLIPKGVEVMTMTSVTLDILGISKELNESGVYGSVRTKFAGMDQVKDGRIMKQLGAAPEWSVASAHAVTEDGSILIASNTGSQLPAAAYGADHVVFVVGAQKIVKNIEEGMKRIYEHTLPLESERAHKAYGVPGSFVSKLLIINKEVQPQRITLIIVNEVLGF